MKLLENKWALVTGTVDAVLPGALVPALLDDFGPSGCFYAAQDYRELER